MLIKNGLVFGENGSFQNCDVRIKDQVFAEILGGDRKADLQEGEMQIDAEGCYVIPGLVDLHLHGCDGVDFCDGTVEAIRKMAQFCAMHGVTTICPTTMTIPEDQLLSIAESFQYYCDQMQDEGVAESVSMHSDRGARVAGLHMEGPFISERKKGAQKSEDIKKPDVDFVHKMQQASGNRVKLLDFAPEIAGAETLIRAFSGELVLSLAHTDADYETARDAMQKGVHHVTHLYNAMSGYTHRFPGVVGAASDDPKCRVELITDGIHVHPSVVRNTFRVFGKDRIILISDSMRATGMPDGEYELGGQKVCTEGRKATLEDGTIAGSVSTLYDCMKTCVSQMGIPIEEAILCASYNPAREIGLDHICGSISEGKSADALVVDQQTLEIRYVILRGRILDQDNIGGERENGLRC